MREDERFRNWKEAVVAFSIEMGAVAFSLVLEIDTAESVAVGVNIAIASRVKDGDTPCAANVDRGIDDLFEIVVGKVLSVPRRKEKDIGGGVFLHKTVAKLTEAQAIVVDADGIEMRSVVVPGDYYEKVGRIGQFSDFFIHRFAKPLPVEGDATTVSAVVGIFHAMFFSKFVVPCVLYRFAVVADIAVAEYHHLFPRQRVGLRKR